MHTISDTIALLWTGATRPLSHALSAAVLALALLGATACGGSTQAVTPATSSPPAATSAATSVGDRLSSVPETTSTGVATAATRRPTAPIDVLIGEPGERMHLRCAGQGANTVLLISGFGTGAEGWSAVESAVAERARVCSYERPGTGTSDPATTTATFASQAIDLYTLLGTAGEPGPYVVVGQSFGGAEAVTFSSLFIDEVIGLVLVDASPATWPTELCAVPDDGTTAASTVRALCTMFVPSGNSEHLDVANAFDEVARIASLGSLPMAVITATRREVPDGLAETEVARLDAAWNQGQQAWMALTSQAHLVSVDATGHHIEIDQPGVVIDQIDHLLP